jgi:hypothetical protein
LAVAIPIYVAADDESDKLAISVSRIGFSGASDARAVCANSSDPRGRGRPVDRILAQRGGSAGRGGGQ